MRTFRNPLSVFFLGLHTATPKMTLIQIAEKVLLLKSWFGSWSLIFRLKHTISWEGLFLHLNIGEQNVSFGWPTSTRATITHTKHTQSSALKQVLFFQFLFGQLIFLFSQPDFGHFLKNLKQHFSTTLAFFKNFKKKFWFSELENQRIVNSNETYDWEVNPKVFHF